LHLRVSKAFAAVEAARAAHQKVMREKASDRAALADANEAIRDAVGELCDTAAAGGAKATREQAAERYDAATRRYARAIEGAQAALQEAVTAAQVFDDRCAAPGTTAIPADRPGEAEGCADERVVRLLVRRTQQ